MELSSKLLDSISNKQRKPNKFYQRGPLDQQGKYNNYQNQSQSSGNIQILYYNVKHQDEFQKLQSLVSNTSIFTTETAKSSKVCNEQPQNGNRFQRFLSKQGSFVFESPKISQKQIVPSFLSISPKIKDIQQMDLESYHQKQDKKFKSFLSSLHIQNEQRTIGKISQKLKNIVSQKYIPMLEKSNMNTQEYHQAKGMVESLVQETGKYTRKPQVSLESIQSTKNLNTKTTPKILKQRTLVEQSRKSILRVDITLDNGPRQPNKPIQKQVYTTNENEVNDPHLIQDIEKFEFFFQDFNNNLLQLHQIKGMNNLDSMNGFTEEIKNLIQDKSYHLSEDSWKKLLQNFLLLQNIPVNLKLKDKLEQMQTSNLFRKLNYFNSQLKTLIENKLQQQMILNEQNIISLQESFLRKVRSYSFKSLQDIDLSPKQQNFGRSLLKDLNQFQEQFGFLSSLKSAEIIKHQIIDDAVQKRKQFRQIAETKK